MNASAAAGSGLRAKLGAGQHDPGSSCAEVSVACKELETDEPAIAAGAGVLRRVPRRPTWPGRCASSAGGGLLASFMQISCTSGTRNHNLEAVTAASKQAVLQDFGGEGRCSGRRPAADDLRILKRQGPTAHPTQGDGGGGCCRNTQKGA